MIVRVCRLETHAKLAAKWLLDESLTKQQRLEFDREVVTSTGELVKAIKSLLPGAAGDAAVDAWAQLDAERDTDLELPAEPETAATEATDDER